jgi:hypothetical protein
VPPGLNAATLVDLFARDKKAVSGLTMVLDGPAGVETVAGLDRAVLLDAMSGVLS